MQKKNKNSILKKKGKYFSYSNCMVMGFIIRPGWTKGPIPKVKEPRPTEKPAYLAMCWTGRLAPSKNRNRLIFPILPPFSQSMNRLELSSPLIVTTSIPFLRIKNLR